MFRLVSFVFLLIACAQVTWAQDADKNSVYEKLDLLAETLAKVQFDYYKDPGLNIDEDYLLAITERMANDPVLADDPMIILREILEGLEGNNAYYDPETFKEMRRSFEQPETLYSFGISYRDDNGKIIIENVKRDTVGWDAGIRPEDHLFSINGTEVLGMEFEEIRERIRPDAPKETELTIKTRQGIEKTLTLTPEIIGKRHYSETRNDIVYVRLENGLYEGAEFIQESLASHPDPKGLILDIRFNNGGSLGDVINISGMFIDGGEIFTTVGRRPADTVPYFASKGREIEVPTILLFNGKTSAGATMIGRALQLRTSILLMGETTSSSGAHLVDEIVRLQDGRGGAMRISAYRIYMSDDELVPDGGVEPDLQYPTWISPHSDPLMDRAIEILKNSEHCTLKPAMCDK